MMARSRFKMEVFKESWLEAWTGKCRERFKVNF